MTSASAMRLAVCSIQRNRGPWLVEWVAFHHLVGVTDFILYLHRCEDDSAEIVARLSRLFRIQSFVVDTDAFAVQLSCFRHAQAEFGKAFDWIAYIDGDEFLLPTRQTRLPAALARFESLSISALGVYWRCFGSAGHRSEPKGLVTENFRRCSGADFAPNRHIKSIVRGGATLTLQGNSHYFGTEHGTVDETLAPLDAAFDAARTATYAEFCINHYATQSREFYERVKAASGAADAGPAVQRPESWWDTYDRNEEVDATLPRLGLPLAETVRGLCRAIGLDPAMLGGLPRVAGLA